MTKNEDDRVPVTVLTGFLGSGKTTLLNRILTENHGRRIAVIENEFGEIGIDQGLVVNADEEIFEMNNGCICCTVRGDLIRVIGNLMRRRDRFDRILVETTGMADPGPVAQTFFVDDEVRELSRLDGIITLVDAKHLAAHIDDGDECKQQLAFADVIVINKIDLVSPEEALRVEERIRSINGMAAVHRAERAQVDLSHVLDVGGFDLSRALAIEPTFLEPEYPFEWAAALDVPASGARLELEDGPDPSMSAALIAIESLEALEWTALADQAVRVFGTPAEPVESGEAVSTPGRHYRLALDTPGKKVFLLAPPSPGIYALVTQHLPEEFAARVTSAKTIAEKRFAAAHEHDATITSVGLRADRPLDGARLNQWLSGLLREKGTDIFRMKGILDVEGESDRFVFQGVHMLLDSQKDRPWGDERRESRLVFIGRHLDRAALERSFTQCLS